MVNTAKEGRLAGKVAIVTGGAMGIGEAISRLFAKEGAKVILSDVNEIGENVAASINMEGGVAEFVRGDVAKDADVRNLIEQTVTKFGQLDILVNNAAISSPKPEVDHTEEEWDRIMAVNVKGVWLTTKYAIPEMKKVGGGSIINFSSVYGIVGTQGFAAYHASKGAVRAYTKSTAIANASAGIRCNSVHPGAIDTPQLRGVMSLSPDPKAAEEAFLQAEPMGRLGQPIEVAYGCVYFASDESKFVTGAELYIDGGYLAQ